MWQSEGRGQLPQAGALGLRLAAGTPNVFVCKDSSTMSVLAFAGNLLRLVLL